MLGKIVSTTLIGALMATAAFAESPTKVKDVDVSIDLTAITNPKAAAYWTTVSDDLEGAIVARVTDQIADDGVNISVDISELALSNSFQSAFDIEQSSLVGDVKITSETNNTKFEAFELSVSFDQASQFLPEGYDLAQVTSDSKEYYTAMIGAFADAVVKHLE